MKRAFLLLLMVGALVPSAAGETQLLDRVVAVVNDEAITQSELDVLLRPVYEQYKNEYQNEQLIMMLDQARQKLLNQLIEDRLVFQEAKTRGIEVNESEIEEQMEELKKSAPTLEALEEALKREGLTLSAMRERLKRQSMIRDLQEMEIRSKVVVSPTEIETYYQNHPGEFSSQEQIKVRTITVKKNDESRDKGLTDEIAKVKIEDARKKILSGEDFEKMAQEISEDTHAQNGGLTDWIHKGEMIPVIDDVIFNMREGELSEIIETPMGYHLFRLEKRKEGFKRALDEVRSDIFAILFREKASKRFQDWMQELKRNAYISIR